jgi:hypothetical protein
MMSNGGFITQESLVDLFRLHYLLYPDPKRCFDEFSVDCGGPSTHVVRNLDYQLLTTQHFLNHLQVQLEVVLLVNVQAFERVLLFEFLSLLASHVI